MSKNRVLVIHKRAGYQGYLDQKQIYKPQWKALLAIFILIFSCGAIVAAGFLVPQFFRKPKNGEAETITSIVEAPMTVDPAFSAIVSDPLPTMTASPVPTQTVQDRAMPTDDLMATVEFINLQLQILQSQTPIPTTTGLPSQTPTIIPTQSSFTAEPTALVFNQYAIVIVDCVVIRRGAGRQYEALDSACRGAEYGIIETFGDWTRIYHPAYETAWIASWLLRIEPR